MSSEQPTSHRKSHGKSRRWLRWVLGLLAVALVAALSVLRFYVLPKVDASSNRVLDRGPYAVSDRARALHDGAFVADLHADALLWKRDLRRRHHRGHVDLPRLRDGGVDLQVFSVVTRVPHGSNYRSNADTDRLPLLFLGSWRGPSTWLPGADRSARSRALAQAAELRRLARRSGDVVLVRSREDLGKDGLKALLATEGMHGFTGVETVDRLFEAGYRMMAPTHFTDTAVAGSAHGVDKGGLTELGKTLLPRLEALGITVDLAHASPQAVDDVFRLATRPVVFSHAGVQGTCPGSRNLSDRQLRRLARNGGVVGIGYWKGAVCDASLKAVTRAILYAVQVAGVDHVGLGSDFDGNITAPFDTAGLPLITEALLNRGMAPGDVEKVLGGNVRRVLSANLPSSGDAAP